LNYVNEAEEAYRQLLDVNPDNYGYIPLVLSSLLVWHQFSQFTVGIVHDVNRKAG
jgi:hypothetical protein